MKYWCETCESLFDEADAIIERYDPSPRGISLPEGSYVIWHCPVCDEEEIEPAVKCELCGEWHSSHEDDLCKECEKEVDEAIKAMINSVAENHGWDFKKAENAIMERIAEAW